MVDLEIESERKKKLVEKKKKTEHQGPTGVVGFRSMAGEGEQQFSQLETMFDLKDERTL